MKKFKLYAAVFVLLFARGSLAALDSETSFVVLETKTGLTNLVIRDRNSDKIVLAKPVVNSGKQIYLLPKSDYEIRTTTLKTNVSIDDDGALNIQNGKFVFKAFPKPQAFVFYRGGPAKLTAKPIERNKYTLAFLDFDNFEKLKAHNYTVNIKGPSLNQDIDFEAAKVDSRFVSGEQISFPAAGKYTITVTVPPGAVPVSPKTVEVIPRPPLNLNVTNTWGGRALQFATAEIFKVKPAEAKSLPGVWPREKYEEFKYAHTLSSRTSTGADGKLTLKSIRDGETAAIVLSGDPKKDVYVKTVTANEDAPDLKLNWQNVPSKGKNYGFSALVDSDDAANWDSISEQMPDVTLYYAPGAPKTIRREDVIKSKSFKKAGVVFRRSSEEDEDEEGETRSSINCFVDLSGVCELTNINYLIVVQSEAGAFSMQNTADEFSATPILYYEEE